MDMSTRTVIVVIEVTLRNLERAVPFSIDAYMRGNGIRTFTREEGYKPLAAELVMQIDIKRLLDEKKLEVALTSQEFRHVLEFKDKLLSGIPIKTATPAYRAFVLALEAQLGQYGRKEGWQIKHPIVFFSRAAGRARLARLKMQRRMLLATRAPLAVCVEYD